MIVTYIRVPVLVYGRSRWYQLSSFHWFLAHVIIIPYRFVFFHLGDQQEIPKLIRKVRSLLSLSASPNVKLFKPFSQYLAQLEWSAVMLQLCSAAVGK